MKREGARIDRNCANARFLRQYQEQIVSGQTVPSIVSMSHEEAQCIAAELDPPFEIIGAQNQRVPIVFNSPHSGRIYPSVFVESSRLSAQALRKSEDAYVDELLSTATAQGAVLMQAHFTRAYIDINREA